MGKGTGTKADAQRGIAADQGTAAGKLAEKRDIEAEAGKGSGAGAEIIIKSQTGEGLTGTDSNSRLITQTGTGTAETVESLASNKVCMHG